MRFAIMTILFLITSRSIAHDGWLCTSQSSEQQGQSIYACGIAIADTEDLAREKALASAQREFLALCDLSDACRNHALIVKPMRTECSPKGNQIKCYRGVLFTPEKKMSDTTTLQSGLRVPDKAKAHARIYKDQTVQELLSELGQPDQVREVDLYSGPSKRYYFDKKTVPGCNDYIGCWVQVVSGRVKSIDPNWSPMMTDAMND